MSVPEPPDPSGDLEGADEDEPFEPRRRSRLVRLVAILAAVGILAISVAAVVIGEGSTTRRALPAGEGPVDLQRFFERIVPHGTADGFAPPGSPTSMAEAADLVVTGRIHSFGPGRVATDALYGNPDRQLADMEVAVEEVVAGELPVGSEGRVHVELGLFRRDTVTPEALAAVAPAGRGVVLYLSPAVPPGDWYRDPDPGARGGQPIWWYTAIHGFYVEDGSGGLVRLTDGAELPGTTLADVLPPSDAWPAADPAPPLGCPPGDGVAGWELEGVWPRLGAVDGPGAIGHPRAATLGAAIDAFATTVRAFPPAREVTALGDAPSDPGYVVVFESLTSRTVAYRDAEGRTLAVFYVGGTEATGWRVAGHESCASWYETLAVPPGSPDAPV